MLLLMSSDSHNYDNIVFTANKTDSHQWCVNVKTDFHQMSLKNGNQEGA